MQEHQLQTSNSSTVSAGATPGGPGGETVVTAPTAPGPSDNEDRGLDTTSAPDPSSSKSPSVWAIVAAVLAAVMLCSLAVGCFMLFRKRRTSTALAGVTIQSAKEVQLPLLAG